MAGRTIMTEWKMNTPPSVDRSDSVVPTTCHDDIARDMLHEASQPLTSISNYLAGARRLLNGGNDQNIDRAIGGLDEALKEVWRLRDTLAVYRRTLDAGGS